MPRIKASPKKCVKSQQASNTWLFLMKGEGLEMPEGCSGTPDMVKLRHPQTGSQAMFLFSPDEGMVQEVLSFSENKRSWFIDDCAKSDGKMHLSTPVDPVFLVLPYLRKSAGRFEPLEQLLRDEDFPETARLVRTLSTKHLSQVAECKGEDGDEALFRFSEEKALAWLGRKVRRVAEVLQQKGLHVGPGAVSANFVRGSRQGEAGRAGGGEAEEYLQYAHGIVAEYVPTELSAKLHKALGLPEENTGGVEGAAKRKLGPGSAHNVAAHEGGGSKKVRPDEEESAASGRNNGILDLTKPEKQVAPSKREMAKDKARSKAAAGSKSITSFFKKK